MTARVEAQRARNEALSQVAQAADRLALLADFTSRMALSQQPHQVVSLLGDVLVPRVGTWCVVCTYDELGRLVDPHIVHERADTDPDLAELLEPAAPMLLPDQLNEVEPAVAGAARRAAAAAASPTTGRCSPQQGAASTTPRPTWCARSALAASSYAPLTARGGILGAVAVLSDDDRPPLGEAEVTLVRDIAVRAGLMLENTQLYARERATTATLQRSLLPRVPRIDGIEIAATYVPAADEAAVGGDWYDVFPLRDVGDGGGIGVVVGDVMGHNYDSAARMGKLSTIVRAYGWPGSDPQRALTAVDELLEGSGIDLLATCMYATLKLHDDGATLRYSSAGHPPAVRAAPRRLDGRAGRGPRPDDRGVAAAEPAGATPAGPRALDLAHGQHADLLHRRPRRLARRRARHRRGARELAIWLTGLPADASPQPIVDTLSQAAGTHDDDVAVVAIRIRVRS